MSLPLQSTSPIPSSLAETIGKFSYSDLAILTGLSRKQVSKLLNGRLSNPSLDTIRKLASGLEVSMDEVSDYLEQLKKKATPYKGGNKIGKDEIEIVLQDENNSTCRQLANKLDISPQSVSVIRRFSKGGG